MSPVFDVSVFCAVVGRVLLTTLESLTILTISSILLDLFEVFLRITVRQREKMFGVIYQSVWKCSGAVQTQEMKSVDHMLLIRVHFILLEMIVESCSM